MKVIFLDIDGVLNFVGSKARWFGQLGIEPALVKKLNDLVELTGAKLVLSSTWRKDDDWEWTMKRNGIVDAFVGRTPDLGSIFKRGREVNVWLSEHPEVENYAIIDDMQDLGWLPDQHTFFTDEIVGLTTDTTKLVAEHLGTVKQHI